MVAAVYRVTFQIYENQLIVRCSTQRGYEFLCCHLFLVPFVFLATDLQQTR
jgi:hypothetical protein